VYDVDDRLAGGRVPSIVRLGIRRVVFFPSGGGGWGKRSYWDGMIHLDDVIVRQTIVSRDYDDDYAERPAQGVVALLLQLGRKGRCCGERSPSHGSASHKG
jgi:hypothetical protein